MEKRQISRFDENNNLHKKIVENKSKLICTTEEYSSLFEELEITEGETDPEIRLILEAQINAYSVKIYNLTSDEFELILQNFPIVEKKSKELTLEEFDSASRLQI